MQDFLLPIQSADVYAKWIGRIPNVSICSNKSEALEKLNPYHLKMLSDGRRSLDQFKTCEQVHGTNIKCVNYSDPAVTLGNYDGLITHDPLVTLGIYVADCAAVFIHDPIQRVSCLLHSGKRGSQGGIVKNAIHILKSTYSCSPRNLIVCISPCIKPPLYELNFVEYIIRDCRGLGIEDTNLKVSKECTGKNLHRNYSYRMESGKTGRMLALLSC